MSSSRAADSEGYSLHLATPGAKLQRDLQTHEAWGARLSVAQYQSREVRLRAHAWPSRAMRSWHLLNADGQVVSSCESFAMASFFEGAPVGSSFGIASVFTESSLRGRGHAERMMRLLEAALLELEPAAEALHLYSDVGEALYARAGYVAVGAWSEQLNPGVDAKWPERVEEVDEQRLPRIWETVSPRAQGLVIWPDVEQLDWHLERERIYAAELGRPRPLRCGARAGDALAIWAADFKDDVLRIVALVPGETGEQRDGVLRAAMSVARESGLSHVERWVDSPEDVSLGTVAARSGSLPMLRSLGRASAADWRAVQRGIWV